MENQLDRNIESEMETGGIHGFSELKSRCHHKENLLLANIPRMW